MLYVSPAITVYFCLLAAIFGSCMGSFLNCMAWRVVHGEAVTRGRSHCDLCGHVLGAKDLIPLFSFLFSRGRCRYCGGRLSWRHCLGELVMALLYPMILFTYDISLQALEAMAFVSLLMACAFGDLEGYMIPDRFILTGVALRIVMLLVTGAGGGLWRDSLLGGFAVGGGLLLVVLVFEKLRHKEAMGGGDIKLLFLTGVYLGWMENLLCLFLACLLGIFSGLWFCRKGEGAIPWGPSIAAAAIITMFLGEPLVEAYLGLF